jgi:hypothetical protein
MSFRDPNEFAKVRQEKGGPPYDHEKQAMAQNEAEIEAQAKAPLHPKERQSEEERQADQEQAAEERLAKIGREDVDEG